MIIPEKKTIEDILSSTRTKFSVPSYQRSFDWGKGELQELIDDLKEIKNSKDKDLFLGNFIFDISNQDNYKIVDGQQRLTTISIIFIAIREHAKKINEQHVAQEIQKYIAIYSKVRNKNEIKISVSENIKDVFELMSDIDWNGQFPDKIKGRSVKRQTNKVKPIFNYIMDSLSEYSSEDLNLFIKALWDTYVIVIKVENTEDVFSIFERTNARGLDLNIGDLLKNYIFSYSTDKFENKWSEIIENAEGSLQRMLKYFWISRKGHIQQSKLYRELKDYVKELDTECDNNGIDIFVDNLYEFSRYYKVIQSLDPELVKDWLEENSLKSLSGNEYYYKKINRVFQGLKLFRVTQAYPLIFSIFKFYKTTGATNHKKLFQVLEKIENYHFVNNVISGRIGNEVEKFYAENASIFYDEKTSFTETIDKFINQLHKKKAHKDEFISNFIETITYNQKNIQLINYVFDRINNYNVKGGQYVEMFSPEKDLQKRNYNIEHVLAQNKKKDNNYNENELEIFDKVGNLIIISRHSNSELQDKNPIEKINIIKSDRKHFGNLRYIDDFIKNYGNQFENWNLDIIEKRSKEIAKNGYNLIWNF